MTIKTFTRKVRIEGKDAPNECPVSRGDTIHLIDPEVGVPILIPWYVSKVEVSETVAYGWDVWVENSMGTGFVLLFDRGGWLDTLKYWDPEEDNNGD